MEENDLMHRLQEMESIPASSSLIPTVLARLGLENAGVSPHLSVKALEQELRDNKWQVRLSAVRRLRLLKDQRADELLRIALDDTDEFVRMMARHALEGRSQKALTSTVTIQVPGTSKVQREVDERYVREEADDASGDLNGTEYPRNQEIHTIPTHSIRGPAFLGKVLAALEQTRGEPGDLASVLQHIAQTACDVFAADACVILTLNPITGRFIGSQTAGNSQRENETFHDDPEEDGVTQQILKDGPIFVEDLGKISEYRHRFTPSEDFRSFVGLTLHVKYHQKPLGVLYLNFIQPQRFTSNDRELFQLFADQASFILHETWLLRRYQEVARIGQEINQELATVDILFQKLQKHAASVLDISYDLFLAVFQPETNTLDVYMKKEDHSITQYNTRVEGAFQYAMETRQTLLIRDMNQEMRHLPYQNAAVITETGSNQTLIFVPLVLCDAPLGVLSIQHTQPHAYNHEDLFILNLLANHIALALHNIRLYDVLSRLNETGRLLTQQLNSEQVLQATIDKILDVAKADVVVLYPYESVRQRFVLPPHIADTSLDSTLQSMSSRQTDDIAALMLHHVEPIFAKEGTSVYSELRNTIHTQQENFMQRKKVRSTAAVPLRVGDESVGVLFINFHQAQLFDAPQKLLIEGLSNYAAIAIKNARASDTLIQQHARELEFLQHIDRELSRNLDLQSVLDTLLRMAQERVSAEEATILLYNPRIQTLESAAAVSRDTGACKKQAISLKETRHITRWALEHKKPIRVDNVHRDPQWQDLYIEASADTLSELDVPLLDGEEVIGVLNFESTREGAFHQRDEDFLLNLAGQAVMAIKRAQAYEREQRFAAEVQVLSEVSKEITSQLDPANIFDLILEKALALTDSHMGKLMLYDPDQKDLWMAAERGVAENKKGLRQGLDQGIVGHVARTKELLNVDLSQPPWHAVNLDFIPGTCSELAVPMLAGNDLLGVLNIESPTPNSFGESDERLLKGLADLAVVALQNAQAYEREKRLVEEERVLNEISKEITSQLDLTRVFDLILEKALALTDSHMGNLMLYDPDLNDLWINAERGMIDEGKSKHISLDQGIAGYVARNKQLLNVEDVTQPPWKEIYLEFIPGIHSELATPMLAGNELRGVLNIESPSPHHFDERDERLLMALADLAVVALQNAERYEQIGREVQRFKPLYQTEQELTKVTELKRLEQFSDTQSTYRLTSSGAILRHERKLRGWSQEDVAGTIGNRKQGRILVVDDLAMWRKELAETLWHGSFHVDIASSATEALARLNESLYHVLVLDIGMAGANSRNRESIDLLSELDRHGLSEATKVIILSAYGTQEQMRTAFREHKVADFLSKDKFTSQGFLESVQRVFSEKVNINLALQILWQQINGPEQAVVNLNVDGNPVKPATGLQKLVAAELEDLLCRLFHRAKSILVRPLTQGHSGTGVLRVQPFYTTGGSGHEVVIKFGDFRKIEQEYHNFKEYVQPFLGGGRNTTVIDFRRTPHLGGIIYSLLGTINDQLVDFGEFYRHADVSQVKDALDQLFLSTCGIWYENRGHLEPLDLATEYLQLLNYTPEILERVFVNQMKSVQGKQKLFFNQLRTKRTFTNPMLATAGLTLVRPTYVCTTHGDFNPHNLLIDGTSHIWMIDFQGTSQSHILRDVAMLDSVVRFQLLASEEATLKERLHMEEALCDIERFSQVNQLAAKFSTKNTALAKVYAIAMHLRAIASRLVEQNPSDDISEYYIALLYNALNTLRFSSLSSVQREHALLSACLLADRLGLSS